MNWALDSKQYHKIELNKKLDDMKKAIESYRSCIMSTGPSNAKSTSAINIRNQLF